MLRNMAEILVVELKTEKEYLESKSESELNEDERRQAIRIKKDHDEHQKTKDKLLEYLDSANLGYEMIEDNGFHPEAFSQAKYIVSLGGDGTFLHATKYASPQNVIVGIKSKASSKGALTKFDSSGIEQIIQKITSEASIETERWDRLSAKINGEELCDVALNEIIIGRPEITDTSHLEYWISRKRNFTRGNGIILSTTQGSTGFYKSVKGRAFKNKGIGFGLILSPEKGKNNVYHFNTKFKISPQRDGHKLSFDCDSSRTYDLNQGDLVEVYLNHQRALRVMK